MVASTCNTLCLLILSCRILPLWLRSQTFLSELPFSFLRLTQVWSIFLTYQDKHKLNIPDYIQIRPSMNTFSLQSSLSNVTGVQLKTYSSFTNLLLFMYRRACLYYSNTPLFSLLGLIKKVVKIIYYIINTFNLRILQSRALNKLWQIKWQIKSIWCSKNEGSRMVFSSIL